MRIVALHTDFRIYWPARLKALHNYLAARGHSLSVIEIAGKGSPYAFAKKDSTDGLEWHILFPKAKPEELSGKAIKPFLFNLLDRLKPDVVLAGAIAFPSGALAVQWANGRRGKRVVIFDDAKSEAVRRSGLVNFVKQNIYNGVDAMFYPAEPWIPTGKGWGFADSQMFFGVDVVDNDFWSKPTGDSIYPFKYFVAVGRQIPKKNYMPIVKAYRKYLDKVGRVHAFHLLLIGDGPEHGMIVDYIQQNRLEDMVLTLPFMSQNELRTIYQHADLLSSSSSSETWGLVINEAMCGGCAIISSVECGATDVLVEEGVNGYKTTCYDIDRTAAAMISYHNLPNDKKKAMQEASRKIIADWGLNRFCDGATKACEYVVSHPKRKPSLLSKLMIFRWNGQYNPV